jgi:hypothetical protein
MKLASYNVENLFLRAKAMNFNTLQEGADILKMHAEINAVLGRAYGEGRTALYGSIIPK